MRELTAPKDALEEASETRAAGRVVDGYSECQNTPVDGSLDNK